MLFDNAYSLQLIKQNWIKSILSFIKLNQLSMSNQDSIEQFLNMIKQEIKPSTTVENLYRVSINIIPHFFLQVNIKNCMKRHISMLRVEGLLFYGNGVPVQLQSLYKDQFFNRLNKKVNSQIQKHGSFIYDPQTLGIKYIAKINYPNQLNLSFQILKPVFINIKRLSDDLQNALSIVGLTKSLSGNSVKIESLKRKYQKKILDIIYDNEPFKFFQVQDQIKSPIVQLTQMRQIQNDQDESDLSNKTTQATYPRYKIKGGYCQIHKRIFTIKTQHNQYFTNKQLAIKNLKKNRQSGQNKIDNQQRILKVIKNNTYLIQYFKYSKLQDSSIMEFIDFTLRDYIYNKPFITISEVIKICIQLLESVLILHHYGVVHRDLKPSNFLIKNTESGIRLKMIDFGQSVLKQDIFSQEETKKLGCTLPYSPIECVSQNKEGFNNFQIDYWSIGIIFYQILYKKIPVSYSRCFGSDIAKGWMRDFIMPIPKSQKNGIRFIQSIFNIICFKMMKVKQDQRMNLNKALSIMQCAKSYLEQISCI